MNHEFGGFDVAVFAAPQGRKRFEAGALLREPFVMRLALGILFEALAPNDFYIEQFEDDEFAATVRAMDEIRHIVGLYRTFDDKYRLVVTCHSESCSIRHILFQESQSWL